MNHFKSYFYAFYVIFTTTVGTLWAQLFLQFYIFASLFIFMGWCHACGLILYLPPLSDTEMFILPCYV